MKFSTKRSIVFILAVLGAKAAFAGVGSSLMQTAPVIPTGEFEIKLQNDIVFNNGGAFNISPHFRTGLVDHFLDGEIYFGTGTIDFQMGGLVKYNLLPDIEGQVGVAFLGGFSFRHDEGINSYLLNLTALVSHDMPAEFGQYTPYFAYQFETLMSNGNSIVPMNLLLGTRLKFKEVKPWNFYGEFSINVKDSVWGFAVGAGYPF